MQRFIYPQDYLKMRGKVKECWEVHKKHMKAARLPYVGYSAFHCRLTKYGWDLYRAIHTPCDYDKLERHEKLKTWSRTQRFRFIYLFKKDDRRRRGKRHCHTR